MLFTFSYSLEQFTLLRTFRICWTLGQRDIIPISCLSSTRISNEYVTFTNCFTNLLLLVIYLPFHRIWEVKSKRLDVSWVNIPTNINSTEWLNICASTNSPQTNPSISSITDGWISWVPTVDSFAMVSCHFLHHYYTFHNVLCKGKTGDWKNHFSPELNARIDEWMKDNLKDTDLNFITELDQQDWTLQCGRKQYIKRRQSILPVYAMFIYAFVLIK